MVLGLLGCRLTHSAYQADDAAMRGASGITHLIAIDQADPPINRDH
jgi:hypothetical protein